MALTQVNGGMLDSVAQQVGFRNRIINGDMRIDQRNAGASVTYGSGSTAGNYAFYNLDRWYGQSYSSTAGNGSAYTVQRSSTVPSGFVNSLACTVTSAQATLQTDSLYRLYQQIEGFNIGDLAWGSASASAVTLSFWVRSSVTGTFSGSVNNASAGGTYYRYIFSYAVSSANTWEYKTVTIPGATVGSWNVDNSTGIQLNFCLGAASGRLGATGSWTTGDQQGATGTTNLMATNGATFYITGVQLEKGSTATSFDYRPYGTELALCQRYFEVMYPAPTAVATGYSNTSVLVQAMKFSVEKRAAPTFTTNASGLTATWTPTGTQMAAFTLGGVSQISGSGTWGINGSATTSQISLSCVAATTFANCSSTTVMVHGGTGVQFNFAAEL